MVYRRSLIAAAGLLAITALTWQSAVAADQQSETPLGLLLKSPEIPHGLSFGIQVAEVVSGETTTG